MFAEVEARAAVHRRAKALGVAQPHAEARLAEHTEALADQKFHCITIGTHTAWCLLSKAIQWKTR